MQDFKLKPLFKENTFWVLLIISLPGIVAAYQSAIRGEAPDASALLASPLAVYLGLGRQYSRAKSIQASSWIELAEDPETNASTEQPEESIDLIPEEEV